MAGLSRRGFLVATSLLSACATVPQPLARPRIGIQLYMFFEAAQADLAGTFRTIAALGYRHVELLAGLGDAATLGKLLRETGLTAPSIHIPPVPIFPGMPSLADGTDNMIALCKAVGIDAIICSAPLIPDRLRPDAEAFRRDPKAFDRAIQAMSRDDWLAHCAFLDRVGAEVARAGLRFGYHNHSMEFTGPPGARPYDLILANTSPATVTMELDCGWAMAAGQDPVSLMRAYPGRFRYLHLKDVVRDPSGEVRTVPLGQGMIDWRAILAEAALAGIDTGYVEQEPPYAGSAVDEAKASLAYLKRIGAA